MSRGERTGEGRRRGDKDAGNGEEEKRRKREERRRGEERRAESRGRARARSQGPPTPTYRPGHSHPIGWQLHLVCWVGVGGPHLGDMAFGEHERTHIDTH